jgi:hypothetical protein
LKDYGKMSSDPSQPKTAFNSKLLSDFICELNIVRRCGLKGEIIRSLEFYPPRNSKVFPESFLKGREQKFAPLASQVMEKIRQRSPV